jgi:hypothetical protein
LIIKIPPLRMDILAIACIRPARCMKQLCFSEKCVNPCREFTVHA